MPNYPKLLFSERGNFKITFRKDLHIPHQFHSHSGYEIVWMVNGEAKYIFEEKVYHLTKGQVLFFKSSVLHKVQIFPNTPYERVGIQFTNEFFSCQHDFITEFKQFLEQIPLPHHSLHFYTWQTKQFQDMMDRLLTENENTDMWGQKPLLELYLLEILVFIIREVKSPSQTNHLLSHSPNSMDMHDNVLKEINTIWDTNWCLDEFANRLHLNKFYLCHFFKKEFGITIQQYILQRRINEAKKLLVNTDLSIKEISEKVGFVTASSFARSFKKHVQLTPREFRRDENVHLLDF